MKTFAFIFFSIGWSVTATSQSKDYVVSMKGDTLRGDVKLLTYERIDRVQVTSDKKKSLFSALQVRSVYFKNDFYKSVQIESHIQFMKVLKEGYLSLLAFRMDDQPTYDGRYLLKKDGTGKELPNLGFRKNISGYLSDCPEVVKNMNDQKYGRSDINKLVDEYNLCINEKTNVVKKEEHVKQISTGKAELVDQLKTKVTALENFQGKQDVLDLLSDISDKVLRQQTISNYQLETLTSLLKDKDQVKEEVERLIAALKN
jgi:hypothetical protein